MRCRRRLAQEPIEPLAGALLADVENLRPFGRDERRKGRGLNRRVLRLGVDRRRLRRSRRAASPSRSRTLPPPRPAGAVSAARRRDEGAEGRDDGLQVRPRAGLVLVEPAAHRRDMGRRVAAAAADDARAAIRGKAGVSAISSGVPE